MMTDQNVEGIGTNNGEGMYPKKRKKKQRKKKKLGYLESLSFLILGTDVVFSGDRGPIPDVDPGLIPNPGVALLKGLGATFDSSLSLIPTSRASAKWTQNPTSHSCCPAVTLMSATSRHRPPNRSPAAIPAFRIVYFQHSRANRTLLKYEAAHTTSPGLFQKHPKCWIQYGGRRKERVTVTTHPTLAKPQPYND